MPCSSNLFVVLVLVLTETVTSQIRASQVALTDKVDRRNIPLHDLVSAFRTVSHNGHAWSFVGDTSGWFFSDAGDGWQPQYHLSSQVSSIVTSPTACVATSFGPECRILYLPLDSPTHGIHVSKMDGRIVHDVWTSDLHGSRLVLGANKQVVLIDDIAVSTSLHRLPAQSDVFALVQRENALYAGLRNGAIIHFDTRIERSRRLLFSCVSRPTSSVTGLVHLHHHNLLASFMDGTISAFDLRFPIQTPWMSFTGNFNAYTIRLPLVTDPHEKFLFAAGQDNRIRIWSLAAGGPPLDPRPTDATRQSAFQHPFEHRVAALQVIEEDERTYLWAASGFELYKYSLGHRSGYPMQDAWGG